MNGAKKRKLPVPSCISTSDPSGPLLKWTHGNPGRVNRLLGRLTKLKARGVNKKPAGFYRTAEGVLVVVAEGFYTALPPLPPNQIHTLRFEDGSERPGYLAQTEKWSFSRDGKDVMQIEVVQTCVGKVTVDVQPFVADTVTYRLVFDPRECKEYQIRFLRPPFGFDTPTVSIKPPDPSAYSMALCSHPGLLKLPGHHVVGEARACRYPFWRYPEGLVDGLGISIAVCVVDGSDSPLGLRRGTHFFVIGDWYLVLPPIAHWTCLGQCGGFHYRLSIVGETVTATMMSFFPFLISPFHGVEFVWNLVEKTMRFHKPKPTRALWEVVGGPPLEQYRGWIEFPDSW